MKQVAFAAVAVFTLGVASLAQGQTAWEPVGARNGAAASYDPASVQRAGTVVTTMVRYVGPEASMPKIPFAGAYLPSTSYQEKMAIDCKASTYAAQQTSGYSSAGRQLFLFNNGASMLPIAERPELQTLQTKVCK